MTIVLSDKTAEKMEKALIHFIILGFISGLTKGIGVLPDGPLNAAVGETVMFTTTLTPTNEPLRSVSWTFRGKDIITFTGVNNTAPEYEGRITLFIYTGSLELRNVTLTDSGEYSVFMMLFGEAGMMGYTRLNVYEPVSYVTAMANQTDLVELISSVRLSCSSSGSPLTLLWLNGSSEVTASDRVQLTDGGSTLTILKAARYDQGPFRCHVSNPVSNNISDPVKLSISFGPENTKLTISPSKEYYEEGSNITLNCSTVSSPAAQFYWFLNGSKLPETEPELRLTNFHRNQSESYSCQAFNSKTGRNETSQPLFVSVLEPVSYVTAMANQTDLIEFISSVRLFCFSFGSSLSFLWLNGSSEVTESNRVQLTDGGSTLTIFIVTRYDQGPFRCRVSNPVSNDTSDPITLSISYSQDFTYPLSSCSGGCIAGAVLASLVVLGAAVGGACYIYEKRNASNAPPPTGNTEQKENEYENDSEMYENSFEIYQNT